MRRLSGALKQGLIASRRVTRRLGDPPGFLIIGAQKGGTTALYSYLAQHPEVAVAPWKETHFFDLNYRRGPAWYRAHFPKLGSRRGRAAPVALIGEASPYYLFHPHVPARVCALLPEVRLLVLLRNPVDRAYSHYHHEVKRGREQLSFEAALEAEDARLAAEKVRLLEDEHHYSWAHQHQSYLARGLYSQQLQRWLQLFAPEQLLIMQSERFYRQPAEGLRRVCAFLGLPALALERQPQLYAGRYTRMKPATRARLLEFFRPHNQDLYDLLDTDFGWERQG